jgi:superfamily I DNA/RNA helicase
MSTWLIPRQELTPEQLRAIELEPKENRIILGGPGSGKTQILLHRAQFLRDQYRVAPDRFHVFVFTKALRAYIESALGYLDLPEDSVSTLDKWCMTYFREKIGGKTPWNKEEKCPDFAAIRQAVLVHLRQRPSKLYEFVLVDEAQDLDGDAFSLLSAMSNHITACADHKQQIYDQGSNVEDIQRMLGIRRSNVTLLETYRCCPYVVQIASQLIEDRAERDAYLRQARTEQIERETPLLYRASNAEDERGQLIEIVRVRLAKGERVAVLFPQARQAYGYAKGLVEAGIEVENPKELDFTTDKPKLMPYHSAKGLTFDAVLMPRLIENAFGKMTPTRINRVMFVGITRAMRWAYFSTIDGENFEPLGRLIAGANGCLTVRNAGQQAVPKQTAPKSKTKSDDVLDLL